ncbi:hypothetical protein [Algoriphagus pacificus]|uniref:Integral membrane protein n=1 Tax=Algoriphagus pacificus TaxID=2811234 RepID=A0ABS3CFQ2_9BACT|nr:hypothetical protein [Algoriphagus pacificus]MBN7815351.1 hypothetical protein [Algoriphagus pacificus]
MKSFLLLLFGVFYVFTGYSQEFKEVPIFGDGVAVQTIDAKVLNEISGMGFSKVHPNKLYVHNDSGGEAKVYILDSSGKEVGDIELVGAKNRDWEDIAVGPGPGGKSYVYVGEIGDNAGKYESIAIYRFAEPSSIKPGIMVNPEKIQLKYPNGPMDAETLMVDPVSGDIFIISKRDKRNTVFRLAAADFGKGETILKEVLKLPITSAVAGDISQDGSQILIKNYLEVYYWPRNLNESLTNALSKEPIKLPYVPEPQGEAIGFDQAGKAYFTLSEVRFEIQPVLYRYPKK